MRPIRVILVLAALLMGGCSRPSPTEYRVLTFNIRFDNPDDGVDAWPNRADWVADVVRSYDPDLIAFQEALVTQVAFLETALPGYTRLGQGRDDGRDQGEFSPIFYRSDRFEALDHGMWWLSPSPDSVGSRGWDAALPRVATWVLLKDGPHTFVFAGTHFDHRGETARRESAGLLRRLIADKGSAGILAGDFNFTDDSPGYQALIDGGWKDAWVAAGRPAPVETFSGFAVAPPEGDRIDYVFTTGPFETLVYVVGDFERDGRRPSDHRPVLARVVRTAQ